MYTHMSNTLCLASAIALLFDLPAPPNLLQCNTLGELQLKSHLLYNFWNTGEPLLMVGYCRNKLSKTIQHNMTKRTNVNRCYFVTLCVIGPEETDNESTAAYVAKRIKVGNVGVVFADGRVARLKQCYAAGVLARYVNCASHDVLSSHLDYLGIPSPTLEDARLEMARRAKAKLKKKAEERSKVKGIQRSQLPKQTNNVKKPKARICKCHMCSKKAYNENMAPAGPERLTIVSANVSDLLQMTGEDTPENLIIVDRMAELSVAGMDIESMTCSVDNEEPEPYCTYNNIDTVTTAGYVRKVQKPIMISHLDTLAYEEKRTADGDPDGDPLTYTVKGNGEHHSYRMIEHYFKDVAVRQKKASEVKKCLAQPMFDVIDQYKKAHFDFFAYHHAHKAQAKPTTRRQRRVEAKTRRLKEEKRRKENSEEQAVADDDDNDEQYDETSFDVFKNADAVWKQSVHGKLEKALLGLVNDYHVFSFYG